MDSQLSSNFIRLSSTTVQLRLIAQPATITRDERNETEYVERTDVGVSITVKLKRGTGTRDQDELIAKAKDATLEDAREDMDILREYMHDLATNARSIQPTKEADEDDES